MSIWRKIWKESLKANSLMFRNLLDGEQRFEKLLAYYKNDGMLYYARGEAYELQGMNDKAIVDYRRAKERFPVEHWKNTAGETVRRVSQNLTAENFFNKNDFHSFLWFVFQKIYEFVYIDDFVRYVCLSALSRATSEWPLSLIDFRTILELQVNSLLENEADGYYFENTDLKNRIDDLSRFSIVTDDSVIKSMHWIRKNGNSATHDIKNIKMVENLSPYEEKKECAKLKNFYEVMQYMNKINKSSYYGGSK